MSTKHAAELSERLSNFKRMATGSAAPGFPEERITPAGVSFSEVAIAIGDWYLTQLRADLNVIRTVAMPADRATLKNFYFLMKDQRNYSAHPADYDRKAEAEAWREHVRLRTPSQRSSDVDLINELMGELCTALDCLCRVAAMIVRNPTHSRKWQDAAAMSPEEEMKAVYANLGRRLPPYQLNNVVRRYSQHPDLARAKSRQERANIAELVAVAHLSAPLQVPYDELLDEFGLVGDSRASALLLIAHGVQASGVPRSHLIAAVQPVWDATQRAGSG